MTLEVPVSNSAQGSPDVARLPTLQELGRDLLEVSNLRRVTTIGLRYGNLQIHGNKSFTALPAALLAGFCRVAPS